MRCSADESDRNECCVDYGIVHLTRTSRKEVRGTGAKEIRHDRISFRQFFFFSHSNMPNDSIELFAKVGGLLLLIPPKTVSSITCTATRSRHLITGYNLLQELISGG